jgi:hypothetical protein
MELTYPLSSGYVADWTVERAMAELVANALDEDPRATMGWDGEHGVAVIADRGPGWPEEALVLGWSTKNDGQIGQFGEGAKLAMLVLCRELGDGAVVVHTAGFSLRPRLERRRLGITDRSESESGLELLVVEASPNRRRVGTRIEVRCDEGTYLKVRSRFRHFTKRRYTSPSYPGVIVPGETGRIYIGGVLLRDDVDTVLAYDFALTRAKHLQNRDRAVIDAWALRHCIADVLDATDDANAVEALVRAALDGTLSEVEDTIPVPAVDATAAQRRAWTKARRAVFGDARVFWLGVGDEEHELALTDRGWTRVQVDLRGSSTENLMNRLGVPAALDALRTRTRRPVWVGRARLDPADRVRLSRAVRAARRRFGADAVGRVRTYAEHPDVGDRWEGFFDPDTGDIALHVKVLADDAQLCATLAHEIAHRRAWQRGDEFADRTRGFEWALSELAGAALAPTRRRQGQA